MIDPFQLKPLGQPVGAISLFAGNADPRAAVTSPIENSGWLFCDGRSMKVNEFPELFQVLGYTYGGSNGQFNIPKLTPMMSESGKAISYIIKFTYQI